MLEDRIDTGRIGEAESFVHPADPEPNLWTGAEGATGFGRQCADGLE